MVGEVMQPTEQEIINLIERGEDLSLEFKSDKKCLPDKDLVAAVVALANTEGGIILLGVEDNGEITGVHLNHQDAQGLAALVFNRTNPAVAVEPQLCTVQGKMILWVSVPKSRSLVSTADGLIQRRRLNAHGKPEAVPFYPHEFVQRQSALGLMDPSTQPVTQLTTADLDPLQRHRIREAIRKYGGEQSLLALDDSELDGALGLVREIDGIKYPTLAGLLLLGNELSLRQHLPAHEAAFQVLHGTDVVANEFFRKPLLQTFEEISLMFNARVNEQEFQSGLFRVPVPNYDRRAFREAFVNSLVHRDYSTLAAVHVKIDDTGLSISSPGGFVDGVNLSNILTAAPRSRNPLLADIVKRIGLAERTGRGIDRIFEGMLRYGRPAPDYSASDSYTVTVQMLNAEPDKEFLMMILQEEDKLQGAMPIDSLIILGKLREERRLVLADFVPVVQKTESAIRATLEKLVEAGLIEARGVGRGRTYTLSASVYRHKGQKAAYVLQQGFEPIQQEQMVLKYVEKHGSINRAEASELCRINPDQAKRLLKRLVDDGSLEQRGQSRAVNYVRRP